MQVVSSYLAFQFESSYKQHVGLSNSVKKFTVNYLSFDKLMTKVVQSKRQRLFNYD